MGHKSVEPALGRPKQEDCCEFQASQGFTVTPYIKNKKDNNKDKPESPHQKSPLCGMRPGQGTGHQRLAQKPIAEEDQQTNTHTSGYM